LPIYHHPVYLLNIIIVTTREPNIIGKLRDSLELNGPSTAPVEPLSTADMLMPLEFVYYYL